MPQLCLLDSCVIYPLTLLDTLLRVAENNLYQIYFSQEILDGATRNLVKDGKISTEKASYIQSCILSTFDEGLVEVPDELAAVMTNHPGDRHVLAAAVVCKAEVIVTSNLKHFPPAALAPWGIEAQHPDIFLSALCDLHGVERLAQIIQKQAKERNCPKTTVLELLSRLEKQVPVFIQQVTTSLYGQEVETTARKILEAVPKASGSNSRLYSGEFYDLRLTNGLLTVVAKDGRGKVLTSQLGSGQGSLSPEDVIQFRKIRKAWDAT